MKTTLILLAVLLIAALVAIFTSPQAKQFVIGCAEKAFAQLTGHMHRQGMLLTVNFFSAEQTTINGPQFGQPLANRVKVNKLGARLRFAEFLYVAPSAGTAPAIADKIIWGKLPLGAKLVNHLTKLYWNTGTASCTLNLGDNVVPARHLAATAVTTTGSVVPEVSSLINAGIGDITTGSTQITNLKSVGAFQVGFNIAGTGIPLGAVIVGIDRNSKSCFISSPATATTAALAITTNGGGYEATDDTNSVANAFASTTDDATLISVVAGAQVANNQVLALKVAFAQD